MNKVTIVGSINVDNILHIKKLPQPGETIAMTEFSKAAGGKGANQAVASSRADSKTVFVGRVGSDDNGRYMLNQFKDNGINIDHVAVTENQQTGQAYILLQESGQNSIIIQHGANFDVSASDVREAQDQIEDSDFVIAQFETPLDAIIEAFKIARNAGKATILNPAPARSDIPDELLKLTDLITPNETEVQSITGIEVVDEASMKKAADKLHEMGVKGVIITVGEKGSYVSYEDLEQIIPAFKVKAVDTTAAGDTFIGALASELKPDLSNLKESIIYASKSSSFTVQKLGAFPSIPSRKIVEQALKED
ncbi:ribokinase [Lactobacillus hominis]|uniref:Ribokinase n=2 Tax=Lactobacillus hominis TaxID=1203033 RepID=I7JV58_9LACO|nr:ribokinase [Lactobacillus hominis]KRM84631.1 ribokinase [Lactobacillus hominis DSM 23910 = CRBIP 24.179]MCT3347887.1 ribokinase [Lactobacillus hominis]CCI82261.1 Ribokinase [Lactobacillus hominis DSM 23910 = CRBIP 24.179]